MAALQDFLNFIDILSFQPKTKIKGNTRFITNLGNLFSLICIITIIIISFSIILEVLTRQNYTIIYNMDNREKPTVQINDSQIALIITDPLGQEIKDYDRYFNFMAKFWKIEFELNNTQNTNESIDLYFTKTNITDVPLTKCQNLKFAKFSSYYSSITRAFPSGVCINFTEFNESLYGKYGDVGGYSTLNIYIRKCVNSTAANKTNCYPEDQIDKKLSQLFFDIISIENDIDSNNFENPLLPYTKSEMLPLSSTIFKNFFKDLNVVKFNTNNGFIFDQKKTYESYRTDKILESVDLRGKNTLFPGTFSQLTFRCTGKSEIYYRSYLRFQAAFAYIGGILQALILFGKCFVHFFSKNSMMSYLFMHLFSYEEINSIIKKDFDPNMKYLLGLIDNSVNKTEKKFKCKKKQSKFSFQDINSKSINFKSNSNLVGNDNYNNILKINSNKIDVKNDFNICLQNDVSNVNKNHLFIRESLNENSNIERINDMIGKNIINPKSRNMTEGVRDHVIRNQNEVKKYENNNNFNINSNIKLQFKNNNSEANLKFNNQMREKS